MTVVPANVAASSASVQASVVVQRILRVEIMAPVAQKSRARFANADVIEAHGERRSLMEVCNARDDKLLRALDRDTLGAHSSGGGKPASERAEVRAGEVEEVWSAAWIARLVIFVRAVDRRD